MGGWVDGGNLGKEDLSQPGVHVVGIEEFPEVGDQFLVESAALRPRAS